MIKKIDQNGFTLVEVMVAMVILSYGILGIASMNSRSAQGNKDALNLSMASNVVQDTIENMMSMDFNDANYFTDTNGNGADGGG